MCYKIETQLVINRNYPLHFLSWPWAVLIETLVISASNVSKINICSVFVEGYCFRVRLNDMLDGFKSHWQRRVEITNISLLQGAAMRQGGREMQNASPPLQQGPFVWQWWTDAHENENNFILQVYWRKKAATASLCRAEREFLSPPFPSRPSTEDGAESSASDSKQSLHANTCSRPETSHQLDSGGISLALSLCYCFCWHQLRHQTGTHRI